MDAPSTGWDLKSAKYAAFAAAGLTFVETALVIAYAVEQSREDDEGCGFDDVQHLDHDCLRHYWNVQDKWRFLQFAFEIVGALAAIAALPAVLSLAELFGKRYSSVKIFVPCFAGAAVISAYGLLVAAGRATVSDWIYRSFTLEPSDLRALTLANLVARGSNTWLFALDELLLGVGLLTISCLVYSVGQLPRWVAHVGTVGGILGIINFFIEVARFGNWALLSVIAGLIAGTIGFIILPVWLIGLGLYIGTQDANNPAREGLMAGEVSEWAGTGGESLAAADATSSGVELSEVAVSQDDDAAGRQDSEE